MAATSIRPLYRNALYPSAINVRMFAMDIGRFILLLAIACIPSVGRELAMVILIVMACGNPTSTLKSLAAGTLITFLNPALIAMSGDSSPIVGGLKWVLLFVACGRSLLSRVEPSKAYMRLIYSWMMMTAALLVNSLFISVLPSISVFKTISFSLGILCVIRLAMLTAKRNDEMLLSVAALGTAIFVTSVPLLVFAAGRSRNGVAFNGVLSHPQSLGVVLLMTGAVTFAIGFKSPQLQRILFVSGLAQWLMIVPTAARTPLMALAIGGVVYLFEIVTRREGTKIGYLLTPVSAIAITGLLVLAVMTPGVSEGFASYLLKGKNASFDPNNPELSLSESSRGPQVFDTLGLAEEHPLFGAGFGVDEDTGINFDESKTLYGVPLTAPIEQGFLPLATLAQLGIVGSIFVVIFGVMMFRLAHRESGETSALFAAIVGVNFGEMII